MYACECGCGVVGVVMCVWVGGWETQEEKKPWCRTRRSLCAGGCTQHFQQGLLQPTLSDLVLRKGIHSAHVRCFKQQNVQQLLTLALRSGPRAPP